MEKNNKCFQVFFDVKRLLMTRHFNFERKLFEKNFQHLFLMSVCRSVVWFVEHFWILDQWNQRKCFFLKKSVFLWQISGSKIHYITFNNCVYPQANKPTHPQPPTESCPKLLLSSKYKKKNANWKSINQLNRIFLFADFIVIRLRVTKGLNTFSEPISIEIIFEFHFNKRWKREWKSRRELLFAELLLFFFHSEREKKKLEHTKKSLWMKFRRLNNFLVIFIEWEKTQTTRWSGECKHTTVIIKLLMITLLVERRLSAKKKQSITPLDCHFAISAAEHKTRALENYSEVKSQICSFHSCAQVRTGG